MTGKDVREAVISILGDIAPDEDVSSINDQDSLREQIDLDSMDFLDIVMELRKQYSIEVPEEDYSRLASLDSCAEYLVSKFTQKAS